MKIKKNGWNKWITLGIIIAIILFAIYIKNKPVSQSSEELVRCIGERAKLYSQIGCHYCVEQEELFGENIKYIDNFICNSDNWKTCQEIGIMGTPTLIINGQKYPGLKSIEKLKELTGC